MITFEAEAPERWIDPIAGADRGRARRGALPGRAGRALPDVHHDQVHQGGDVPARRLLDAERVRPRRRRRDLGQPAAALRADPVFLALALARRPGADLARAGQQRAARGRQHGLPSLRALGDEDARRPAEHGADRPDLEEPAGGRRAASSPRRRWSSAARSSASSAWSRWPTRSTPTSSQLMPPEAFEAKMRAGLPPWQKHLSADDYVEFCWHAPTVRLLAGAPALRPPSPGYVYPTWAYNALGGLPAAVDPGLFVAARTMALTLVDLATRPDGAGRRAGGVPRAHRRRAGRSGLGRAAAAGGLRAAGGPALAGIRDHRARRASGASRRRTRGPALGRQSEHETRDR